MQYTADLIPGGRLSTLAVGPPKTGKTLFAASFPEPYFASTDNRMMPVRTFGPFAGKKIAFDYFTEYPKLIKKFEELDRHCPYGTVVLDNLTFSGELAISYATGLSGQGGKDGKGRSKGVIALPTIEDWMGETEAIKDLLNILVTLPCHIILIAHIMVRQTNNIKTGESFVEQTLVSGAKRTASIVTGYFDEVYQFDKEITIDGSDKFTFRTSGRGAATALPLKPIYDFTGKSAFDMLVQDLGDQSAVLEQLKKDAASRIRL